MRPGQFRSYSTCVACALALAATLTPAAAEDTVKVALGQRGNWETAASELGQNAGLFRKRGLELELLYTNGSAETLQAVISGSVDIGIGLGTSAVMGAFAKGAPLRAIGNASAGSSEYWYVPADFPDPDDGGRQRQDHRLLHHRIVEPPHRALADQGQRPVRAEPSPPGARRRPSPR